MNNNDAPLEPAAVTAMLRANVFTLKSADIGLNSATCPPVWGVMMELGYRDVVASLVVLADGSTSVYLSDGSGAVGCGLYSEVRQTAANMLHIAQRLEEHCVAVTDYPTPSDAQVYFYLLTSQGILSATATRHDMDEGANDLAELYYAGHSVIGMIELLGAGIDVVDEIRLAQHAVQKNTTSDTDVSGAFESGSRKRGRTWRILPTAGSAARRWHN